MALVHDNRSSLKGQPALHALMVGVSAYPHLPEPDAAGVPETFEMRQLTTAARTAAQLTAWLIESTDYLACPLASVRLLLAPTDEEREDFPELCDLAGEPTLEGFLADADEWRKDADDSEDCMTLFFFAGHGMQGPGKDEVLVLQDFADGPGPLLRHTVRTGSLVAGMAPTDRYKTIARRQLYFVDACRDRKETVSSYDVMHASSAFDVAKTREDYRQIPQYYAAVPGAQARAKPEGMTLFGDALLRCLRGAAGARRDRGAGWHVSVGSLARALKELEKELQRINRRITFDPRTSGDPAATIVRLAGIPDVDITLSVRPRDAVESTTIVVLDGHGSPVAVPIPLDPHPYRCRWPAGAYKVDARVQPGDRLLEGEYLEVIPPSWYNPILVS